MWQTLLQDRPQVDDLGTRLELDVVSLILLPLPLDQLLDLQLEKNWDIPHRRDLAFPPFLLHTPDPIITIRGAAGSETKSQILNKAAFTKVS